MRLHRRLIRSVVHARVYFLRSVSWLSGGTFSLVLWDRLEKSGYDLSWWEMALVIIAVVHFMVCLGWLEFKVGSVDYEQELWSQHNPTLKRIEEKK